MRSKYYKTGLILTCGLSEGSLGEPFCENPLGFDGKTAIATLARSGGVRNEHTDQSARCAQGSSGKLRWTQWWLRMDQGG